MSRIARIEVIPIASPTRSTDDLDGTTETVIVKVYDEDGLYGFGETDAPPEAVKSFLEMPSAHLWSRNATDILKGTDPIEIAALWQKLYEGTFWPGRRGLGCMLSPQSTSHFMIWQVSSWACPLISSWEVRGASVSNPIAQSGRD